MATYFPTSNNQIDAPPMMLYSRDSLASSYSETTAIPGNSMTYMSFSSSSGTFPDALPENTHRQTSCIDIQPAGTSGSSASQQEVMLNFGNSSVVEHNLSSWKDCRNEMLMMQSLNGSYGVLQGVHNFHGQGLSLSLGTHIPSGMQISPIECQSTNASISMFLGPNGSFSSEKICGNDTFDGNENDDSQTKQLSYNNYMLSCIQGSDSDFIKSDIPSYGVPSIARSVPSSKYLKAAQQLLDEVANVKKALREQSSKKESRKDFKEGDGELGDAISDPCQAGVTESSNNSSSELSAAEKKELQNKTAKLLSMLDEVDRWYKLYYNQMKLVVYSFDVIAGSGAAKSYTALALQTISCHFRYLCDAINCQIQLARRNLGEPDDSSKGIGISRLRYVDKQLRQHKALQQLGMMPQHAWRPQRGLPETSVSILRAWLFEHFLHPYPKDSDKIMLARQTGLTRSQVSNWFINARVRLWKPMVEEMHKEETVDTEIDSNSSSETTPTAAKTSQGKGENLNHGATSSRKLTDSNSKCISDIEMMESDKHYPSYQNKYGIRTSDFQKQVNDCNFFPDTMAPSNYGNDRYLASAAAAYHISELERFSHGNGVSLTLGLEQCEGSSIAISNESRGGFAGIAAYGVSDLAMETEASEFDCLDAENRQQQFVPSRLFHDFVA